MRESKVSPLKQSTPISLPEVGTGVLEVGKRQHDSELPKDHTISGNRPDRRNSKGGSKPQSGGKIDNGGGEKTLKDATKGAFFGIRRKKKCLKRGQGGSQVAHDLIHGIGRAQSE